MADPIPSQAGKELPSFQSLPKEPLDPLADEEFVKAPPALKHEALTDQTSPYYNPEYVKLPPHIQQQYVRERSPSTVMGMASMPQRTASGDVRQQTAIDRAVNPYAEPLAKLLLTAIAARYGGAGAEALLGRMGATGAVGQGVAGMAGRSVGAGAATGAMMPEGSLTDRLVAGGKGAAWNAGGEGLLRVGAGLARAASPLVERFGAGAFPAAPKAAVPPSNPVATTNAMITGGNEPGVNPALAARHIINPNTGQSEVTIHAPSVERELVRNNVPLTGAPVKDLLVSRTPNPGTPAVPMSLVDRILKSGAVGAASQDPHAQTAVELPGVLLLNKILQYATGGERVPTFQNSGVPGARVGGGGKP